MVSCIVVASVDVVVDVRGATVLPVAAESYAVRSSGAHIFMRVSLGSPLERNL